MRGEKVRPKIPLSTNIRSYTKMEIESIGSHELHELDDIISLLKVILKKKVQKKVSSLRSIYIQYRETTQGYQKD